MVANSWSIHSPSNLGWLVISPLCMSQSCRLHYSCRLLPLLEVAIEVDIRETFRLLYRHIIHVISNDLLSQFTNFTSIILLTLPYSSMPLSIPTLTLWLLLSSSRGFVFHAAAYTDSHWSIATFTLLAHLLFLLVDMMLNRVANCFWQYLWRHTLSSS